MQVRDRATYFRKVLVYALSDVFEAFVDKESYFQGIAVIQQLFTLSVYVVFIQ